MQEKCFPVASHWQLHRSCTEQFRGVPFLYGSWCDWYSQSHAILQSCPMNDAHDNILINKWELKFKTAREWLLSLLTLMDGRIRGWKEKSKKERWCHLQSPYLHDYALWEGHQPKEHKPLHASFLGPSTQGKFGFLGYSGGQELLAIYVLTWDNCPL